MRTTNGTVATRIRVALAERNESQAWLARRIDWTEMKLSARMTGRIPFNLDDIDLIGTALEMEGTELLFGVKVLA